MLRVRRDDPSICELVEDERAEPGEGEALLVVERFGLTANNVTYAVTGDLLQYWCLFVAPDPWGAVPAWGHVRVERSNVDGLEPGSRFTGLVPMASSFVARPQGGASGFLDGAEHRTGRSALYNFYAPLDDDDELLLLLRPLFGTSVVLDLVLADDADVDAVVLTSASSRTALGLAHLLRERGVRTIGLTSPSRVGWVAGLGLLDEVRAYGDAGELATTQRRIALADFAGNRAHVRAVHEALGDRLARSLVIGVTDWEAQRDDGEPLPGPEPAFFFAPTEIEARGAAFGEAFLRTWPGFRAFAADHVRVEHVDAGEGLLATWRALVAGEADPAVAHVVVP